MTTDIQHLVQLDFGTGGFALLSPPSEPRPSGSGASNRESNRSLTADNSSQAGRLWPRFVR